MSNYLLAIDQGTTSSRAIIFSSDGKIISQYQIALQQYYPHDGWVEHDPEQIWQSTLTCCRNAIHQARLSAKDILAIGISNQRETSLLWERDTGRPVYPAIVWQDRRTAAYCQELSSQGLREKITEKTGLLLDPYFSATKLHWLLENIPNLRIRAEKGELAFGTVDSFLLWRFTNGKRHLTDATNAARTLLYNIHTQKWDDELLQIFAIPSAVLPEVVDNCADFGITQTELFGQPIPIAAMAGDQQAATIGQMCFQPGMIKCTYGTGGFLLLNTGEKPVMSKNNLITTIAYRLAGKVTYGLEGSIFIAGATIQWLRDQLKFIATADASEAVAMSVKDNGGVYLVPAFTGLGAPYWQPNARGAIFGLTRDAEIGHIVRAALEAVCYQTKDLLATMYADNRENITILRVDGGMTANNWLLQFLADILDLKIERPEVIETSALGVAYLAGLQMGIYQSLTEINALWQLNRVFMPNMPSETRNTLYQSWLKAVQRVLD